MPTPVSSILPVTSATSVADAATPEMTLQAGSVVDAKVVSLLADNLVRIAIANLSLDVMSEVALAPGQNLQVAVSRNDAGVRLAIVDGAGQSTADQVTLTPSAAALVDKAVSAPLAAVARNPLTPLEQIAVSVASSEAVTKQGSQAPLFADLTSVVDGSDLPPALKQAMRDVLAQQTPLDPQLGGDDIEAAFQKSGLLFEASLASGAPQAPGTVPDLKAALLVLRQTLAATSGSLDVSVQPQMATPGTAPPSVVVPQVATSPEQAALKTLQAPPLSPDLDAPTLPAAARVAAEVTKPLAEGIVRAPAAVLPRAVAASVALSLLQEAVQDLPRAPASMPAPNKSPDAHGLDPRTTAVPPPFRGALPSAQPIALPSLAPDAPLSQTVHRLLGDTDAAIARQTLLQVASLPDRVDSGGHRIDPSAPQWNFEIPFATPQGTAMAQFEISRDGGTETAESGKRAWRARFSLNVEPSGPIHALITLIGEKTSVRMWAERPATVAQLRAGVGELNEALNKAELKTGDIVIREGTPPQPAPAKAGHFLDRAL